jgi:hypothetical protein
MNVVAQFDPSVLQTDTFTVPTSAVNGKMVIYNESNISLQLSFQSGDTAYVPAWMAMIYPSPPGNMNITWAVHTVLNSSSPPLSLVIVEIWAQGEVVPGTFPLTLVRQANVGNSVGTIV